MEVLDLPRATGPIADLLVNRSYNAALGRGTFWNRIGIEIAFRLDWGRMQKIAGKPLSFATNGGRHADAVVFCTPWLVEGLLAELPSAIRTWAVVLDLAAPLSPGWNADGFDRACAPTEEARRALRSPAVVLGAPVFPPTNLLSATAADDGCSRTFHAAILGGREGSPTILPLAKVLARNADLHLDVFVGRRPALFDRMRHLARQSKAVMDVHSFVGEILSSMVRQDVIVTKPGTLTICEALSLGKPLLLDGLAGLMPQEIGNARFVASHGAGILVRKLSDAPVLLEGVGRDVAYARAARSLREIAGVERIAGAILADL